MKALHLIPILITFLLISSCDTQETAIGYQELPFKMSPQGVVMGATMANEHLMEVRPDALLFEGNATQLDSIQVGDVLVSGISENAPDGFLRRIVGIEQAGTSRTFQTAPAALSDIIESGSGRYEGELLFTEDGSSGKTAKKDLDLNARVNIDLDGNTRDDLRLQYTGKFNATFEVAANFADFSLQYFRLALQPKISNQVKADLITAIKTFRTEKNFGPRIQIPNIQFTIGIVPVVLKPELVFKAFANGSLDVAIRYSITHEYEKRFGIEYSNGKWRDINKSILNNTTDALDLYGNANANIGLKAVLDFNPYGLSDAITLFVEAGPKLNASASFNPPTVKCKADFVVALGAGGKLEVLDRQIIRYEAKIPVASISLKDLTFPLTNIPFNIDIPSKNETASLLDVEYNPENDHFYLIYQSPVFMTWLEAQQMTQSVKNGYLVTPTTEEENNFIKNNILNQTYARGSVPIGLTDAFEEGNWAWTSGESSSFRDWNPGEPNSSNGCEPNTNEDFAHYFPIGNDTERRWNDTPGVGTCATHMKTVVIERAAKISNNNTIPDLSF